MDDLAELIWQMICLSVGAVLLFFVVMVSTFFAVCLLPVLLLFLFL